LQNFFIVGETISALFMQPGYLERTSALYFVGAAFSRDRFNSRLPATSSAESKAAPTGVFFSNLDLPDKRIMQL
jgi:hypothetical protein